MSEIINEGAEYFLRLTFCLITELIKLLYLITKSKPSGKKIILSIFERDHTCS
jgi:hypothetical protein